MVLVEVSEDLSEILWSSGQELVGDLIFAESNVTIVINIESSQKLFSNFLLVQDLNVFIVSEGFDITDTFFNGVEDFV